MMFYPSMDVLVDALPCEVVVAQMPQVFFCEVSCAPSRMFVPPR